MSEKIEGGIYTAILGGLIAIIVVVLFGAYAIPILLVIAFGLLFSNYFKNKMIVEDIQQIKIKLGIEDQETRRLQLLKTEKEEEERWRNMTEAERIELDKEIERELENYMDNADNELKPKKDN